MHEMAAKNRGANVFSGLKMLEVFFCMLVNTAQRDGQSKYDV